MHNKIVSIVRIFPGFEKKIDFLFLSDENFRDLCLDHILCAAMVLKMKKELAENTVEIEEYEMIQKDLEQEILQIILKVNNYS